MDLHPQVDETTNYKGKTKQRTNPSYTPYVPDPSSPFVPRPLTYQIHRYSSR